jgi:ferredoxin
MSSPDDLKLTYVIDTDACAGHGRCYTVAPESFEADEAGYGRVIGVAQSATERAAMEHVAGQCPEQAISVRVVGPEA